MDLRKLVKKVTERTEKPRPTKTPDSEIAALAAREVAFESQDLSNLFFSAGGGYGETIKGEDIQRLANARAVFGHLKNSPPAQLVGYLTHKPSGEVLVTYNGTPVDRLKPEAAKRVTAKISEPTPVKIEVSIIPNRDPKFDRPHIKLMRGKTPPKP
jgi:hypothetical protein